MKKFIAIMSVTILLLSNVSFATDVGTTTKSNYEVIVADHFQANDVVGAIQYAFAANLATPILIVSENSVNENSRQSSMIEQLAHSYLIKRYDNPDLPFIVPESTFDFTNNAYSYINWQPKISKPFVPSQHIFRIRNNC